VTDGDAAVSGFYLDGGAALADLGVDVMAKGAVDGDGEVDGDAPVDRGGDEMGGVVVWSVDGDSAVGGSGEQSFSVPLGAVEGDIETAVDGSGVNFAAQVAEGEAAVGGLSENLTVDIGDVDAAVFCMEFGGDVARDVQTEVDIPTAAEESEKPTGRRAFSADRSVCPVGEDLDFLEQGSGFLGA
jgi:hypothetical protein